MDTLIQSVQVYTYSRCLLLLQILYKYSCASPHININQQALDIASSSYAGFNGLGTQFCAKVGGLKMYFLFLVFHKWYYCETDRGSSFSYFHFQWPQPSAHQETHIQLVYQVLRSKPPLVDPILMCSSYSLLHYTPPVRPLIQWCIIS